MHSPARSHACHLPTGTQSDYHTHAHDLPPQMGGCYSNRTPAALAAAQLIDSGCSGEQIPEASYVAPPEAPREALSRVFKHRNTLVERNPSPVFDEALRAALTLLVTGEAVW